MAEGPFILAIDQGTTSTRAMLFDRGGRPHAMAAEPVEQIYPQPGWVEHDPEAIWNATLRMGRAALQAAGAGPVTGIGITNQRETTVLWERASGAPVANAIVWQDRRTADLCDKLKARGLEEHVARSTGLVIDPYFSATKIAWLLAEVPGLRARAERGEICFGTVESWLVFKLTGGRAHVSDATNASRTMLFDIGAGAWDPVLLEVLDIPAAMLPEVVDCQGRFGTCEAAHFGRALPVTGLAGDQQAAAFGQACLTPGMVKATYGTGCFALANTGASRVASRNGMLATIAHQIDGRRSYALEGAIFMAGATLQWLRDSLGLFADVAETEAMAQAADPRSGVVLVPAFQGLGAPYWDAGARGAVIGLTRATSRSELVRAGLECVAFQTRDLLDAMAEDMVAAGLPAISTLRVDGGMTPNGWLMQFLADMLALPVEVAKMRETTAQGAAFHAGLATGLYASLDEVAGLWRPGRRFEPRMDAREREERYDAWRAAVDRTRSRGL